MSKLQIFISSTMDDLQDERMALVQAIDTNRFWKAVIVESFVARSEFPREVCLQEVRQSHIYMGIFKNRYGYIPKENNPQGLSVVVLEYQEAKNNHLPILIFIYKNPTGREHALTRFLEKISDFDKGHWRTQYSTKEELVQFAIDAINHEVTRRCVDSIEAERKQKIGEIYNLPYFKRVKGELLE